MNDEQSNQSAKNILEDIKKATSAKSSSDNAMKIGDVVEIAKEKEDENALYLEEEYLEGLGEDSKEQNNEK
ncbi:hypothetical protein [Wolbachia endosymbiont of Litomosoides sigmodontis]|uniref:hypothetical protein n=1 Tax=Wolbachia endosymbiont of Litomosoides sigmodontis TaxID=80850 RepID=UPI001FE67A93|nr:hypothetical protein [Wolbachia endosymbiont of Litomosoides sigmodontis]